MKSQIFKTVWQIFKSQKISFSQALIKAWEFSKKATSFVRESWDKKKSTVYSAQIGDFKAQSGTLANLYAMFMNHKPVNMDGAVAYYGHGLYNAD
jgi:hypothetical protein